MSCHCTQGLGTVASALNPSTTSPTWDCLNKNGGLVSQFSPRQQGLGEVHCESISPMKRVQLLGDRGMLVPWPVLRTLGGTGAEKGCGDGCALSGAPAVK